MVIPDTHNQSHARLKGITHDCQSTTASERVGVAKGGLLGGAEVVCDGVVRVHAVDVRSGVLDDFAVLNVDTTDFDEVAGRGVVGGDELGDDGELGAGIDGQASAEEGLVSHAVRVEIAAILVTRSVVPLVIITAVGAGAALLSGNIANMRSVGGRLGVGFPDVHLIAARAVLAGSGVGVAVGRSPVKNVGLLRA